MYLNFRFLDQFLFELSCKNTHTHTHTDPHKDSNEYSIVAFCTVLTLSLGETAPPRLVDLSCDCKHAATFFSVHA